ncbi:MAG: DUF6304 family protein [Acidobacteriota bacterium]|nr:DUF6304 family protein [Acidobacteriota bacterium]
MYPAKYSDKFGDVISAIHNDGEILRINLRGIEFTGKWLDDFEAEQTIPAEQLKAFPSQQRGLSDCTLEWEMPLDAVSAEQTLTGVLFAQLRLGKLRQDGGLDHVGLLLKLNLEEQLISSRGLSGFFEGELLDIQKSLPISLSLKCCFGCAYSDYSPYGQALFGTMACFRNNKAKYLSVENKYDLLEILDTAFPVQETYVCSEFQVRKTGTGYRG